MYTKLKTTKSQKKTKLLTGIQFSFKVLGFLLFWFVGFFNNKKPKTLKENWIPVKSFVFLASCFLVLCSLCRAYCCMSMYYIRSNFSLHQKPKTHTHKKKRPKKTKHFDWNPVILIFLLCVCVCYFFFFFFVCVFFLLFVLVSWFLGILVFCCFSFPI